MANANPELFSYLERLARDYYFNNPHTIYAICHAFAFCSERGCDTLRTLVKLRFCSFYVFGNCALHLMLILLEYCWQE